MIQNKTFRLFISSTFNDLKEERNHLQNEVFPEIKEFCKSYGYSFEPIDLRWGVTDEAGLDHKAMEICINEVKKVFNYPKPNFLVMLGDRYGWIPAPTYINAIYFNKFIKYLSKEELEIFNLWYKEDLNSIPEKFILQPIHKIIENRVEYYSKWQEVESIIVNAIMKHKRIFPKELLIGKSATEQEIIKGVWEQSKLFNNGEKNILCMIRKIRNHNFVMTHNDQKLIDDNQKKLNLLKKYLRKDKNNNIEYVELKSTIINKENELKPDKEYLENYGIKVKEFLKARIKNEINRLENDVKFNEDLIHKEFKKDRTKTFIGRNKDIKNVYKYIENKDNISPFVIYGESGVGKSAFMSKIIDFLEKKYENKIEIIYRFIGISEISSQAKTLLDNIIFILENSLNIYSSEKSKDYTQSVNLFNNLLFEYSQKKDNKLVIVLDALDQFVIKNDLAWIESYLPKNVKIILSTLPEEYGEYLTLLKTKIPSQNIIKIEKLDYIDGEKILNQWLKINKKKLTTNQHKYILEKFSKNNLPLYLKILFDKSLFWKSYDDYYKSNDETLEDLIKSFFYELTFLNHHSKMLVEHTLGYISASLNGLSESELVDILSLDNIVIQDIANPYHKMSVQLTISRIPSAVWSRIFYDLLKYLTYVEFDGIALLNFYHRKIKETVENYYYQPNKEYYHNKLVEYFWNQPLYFSNTKLINQRKLSQLPYHCIKSNAFSKFLTLYNLDFIDAKVKNSQLNNLFLEIYDITCRISNLNNNLTQEYKNFFIETLVNLILDYLIKNIKNPSDERICVEDIHAFYVYRPNKFFYSLLLETISNDKVIFEKTENIIAIKSYYCAFSARKANMIRREGKLDEALIIYEKLEEKNLINILDEVEQSRIYYDIGYIAYLSGDFKKAIENISKSADITENKVSKYISLCLVYRLRFLVYNEIEEFEELLKRAFDIFYSNRLKNPGAKRWVKNVYAHLFEVNYAKQNLLEMKKYFELLKSDDWMASNQNIAKYSSFSPYEARIKIIEKDYKTAVDIFHGFIYEIISDNDRKNKESMARDYYDYLFVLKKVYKKQFIKEYKIAMNLPSSPGNHIWKEKIKTLYK